MGSLAASCWSGTLRSISRIVSFWHALTFPQRGAPAVRNDYNGPTFGEPMQTAGRVESLLRYPVKSMRGEPLSEAFAGFAGIYGDRMYAFCSTGAAVGFPFLTAREQAQLLLYTPRFRRVEPMHRPPNLDQAEALGPGVTPLYPAAADTAVDVVAPDGQKYAIDDPKLLDRIKEGL